MSRLANHIAEPEFPHFTDPEFSHFNASLLDFAEERHYLLRTRPHVIYAFQRSSSDHSPDLVPIGGASWSRWITCFPAPAFSASDLVWLSRASPISLRVLKRISSVDFLRPPRVAGFRSFGSLCRFVLPVALRAAAVAVRLRGSGRLGRHCGGHPCAGSVGPASRFSRDLSRLEHAWVGGHPLRGQHGDEIGRRGSRVYGDTSSLSFEPPPDIHCPHNHFHARGDISAIER